MGEVVLEIPSGMHVNSDDPPVRWLTPTSVRAEGHVVRACYPQAEELGFFGKLVIAVEIEDAKPGSEVELTVSFQACTDSECLAPEERALRIRIDS
jgi:hypothetical protein